MNPSDELSKKMEAAGHDKWKCQKKCTQEDVDREASGCGGGEQCFQGCDKEGTIITHSRCCENEENALCEDGYKLEMPKGEEWCIKVTALRSEDIRYWYFCIPA